MKSELEKVGWPAAGGTGAPGMPVVADRATFQAGLDALLVREKAHTREVTRSRPPAGGCRWWRWTPPPLR
jgi:hypothetical protein